MAKNKGSFYCHFSLPLNKCTSKVNRMKKHETSTTMSFYLFFSVFKETKNVLLFQNIKICANSTNVEMFRLLLQQNSTSCSKTPQAILSFKCSWMNTSVWFLILWWFQQFPLKTIASFEVVGKVLNIFSVL